MKVCLVVHGYPPELVGGTEKSVQTLAHALARTGVEVVVVAGSIACEQGFRTSEAWDEDAGVRVRVRRIHRADLYFDHWQKSASAPARAAFRSILAEERPDVVHVQHWIRLSRDLVATAAAEKIPAVVTLHDFWTSCLIAFRVRPDTRAFCEVPLASDPCLDCAAQVPPRTPWMDRANQMLALEERRADLVRELELARAVLVPTPSHARALARFLGIQGGLEAANVALRVVPHGRDLSLVPRAPLPRPDARQRLVLGVWGHLHPLKGQDLLLGAIRRLSDPSRVELRLAGAESDADFVRALRQAARGLVAVFHGPFRAEELGSHPVSAVHFMASGTRALETWGLVVDEALALGLPMILPRSGAFADRLTEGHGVLFYERGNEADLARVLASIQSDPGSVERVREKLPAVRALVPTVEDHLRTMLGIYEEVVRQGAPRVAPPNWWRDRLQEKAEEAWDRGLSTRSAEELGLA